MPTTPTITPRERTLYFLANPEQWMFWPFLPMVRRRPGTDDDVGIVYDAMHDRGLPGYSATVILTNLFLIPETPEELLKLPKEMFDTFDEMADAGWNVD